MSDEALRRAGELLVKRIDHIGCQNCGNPRVTTGGATHCRSCEEALAAWAAALSEGQAPEPVAQEPVAQIIERARHLIKTAERFMDRASLLAGAAIERTPVDDSISESYSEAWRGLSSALYECRKRIERLPLAGMDTARAKAIEECAGVCARLSATWGTADDCVAAIRAQIDRGIALAARSAPAVPTGVATTPQGETCAVCGGSGVHSKKAALCTECRGSGRSTTRDRE
jgi:uncharacterized Zn finger protein (UPF0148 family)